MSDPIDPVICALTGATTDTVGTFRYDVPAATWRWSPAVYRIHGFEPGDVIPCTIPSTAIPTTAIRTGQPFWYRHRILDTRQRVRTVVTLGHGVPDSDGSITEIHGYVIDVTDIDDPDPTQATLATERAAARATIEQAKGALMISYGIDHTEAFDVLRRHSQNSNVKLRDIAVLITDHIGNPGLAHLPAATRMTHILRHITHPERLTGQSAPRHRGARRANSQAGT